MKMWKKFYECDCAGEGIMISYETNDPYPVIDLAFFGYGFNSSKQLNWFHRLRWSWYILRKGLPWNDMVILTQDQAKELGTDLLYFANKKVGEKDE